MNKINLIGIVSTIIVSCSSPSQHQLKTSNLLSKSELIEITTFKLNKGVGEKDFIKYSHIMQKNFLEKQNGFINRTLCKSADSIWTDLVYWNNQKSFENAMNAVQTSEVALPFLEKIDLNSVKTNLISPIIIE